MMRRGMVERSGAPACPPLGEEDAKALFPGDEFAVATKDLEGAKVAKAFEVSFKDVNALLKSPYGRAHSLSLGRRGPSEAGGREAPARPCRGRAG